LGLIVRLLDTVGLNAMLCTFNVRHFRTIPALVTEQPYVRNWSLALGWRARANPRGVAV